MFFIFHFDPFPILFPIPWDVFITYAAAHHQRAIKIFWLYDRGSPMLLIDQQHEYTTFLLFWRNVHWISQSLYQPLNPIGPTRLVFSADPHLRDKKWRGMVALTTGGK